MLLNLTSDQEFFRDTTARFLGQLASPTEIRRLRNDAAGFGPRYWQRGAELGWTSLLVSKEHGGGSISADGPIDLTLVAHEFGRHAAPGPLLPANIVAAALSDADDGHEELLAGVMAGTSIAAWCYAEPRPNDRLGLVTLDIRVEGSEIVANGVKRPVEFGSEGEGHLLVTGRTARGLTQIVVPTDAVGLSMRPMHALDLTRRFCEVELRDVRVPKEAVVGGIGTAAPQVEHQLQLALVIANAESVGAMQAALDMTVGWAFDRYSFGRPLASYQELKHRFADMKTWLEASHAVSDAAARAVSARSPGAGELVSAAKAFIGDYGSELIQDCVQIHGGIGITFDHDLHLFLRRHTMNRSLYGTPAEHRLRITDILERKQDAA
jgi:alkylation response protein AidB-like acyl-CoA dehydrogenase